MIILAELSPLDTVAGARKLLRASSANDPAVTGLGDVIWRPAISEEAEIGIQLFKGDFDGRAAPSTGSLSIQIDQWLSIEPNARRFLWQGAPVKLYAGVSGQAWPWPAVFEGLVDQFNAQANTVKLNLKVNTEPFDADVLTLKYAGTGGAEGDANLKDKVKPFLLGRCFNVEPVLINAVDNVLQFSGYGPIQAVNKLYERGSEFGASSGNYATYAALVAATIAPGQWATCLAQGMVRLGAKLYGVITGDVDGDTVGGTWWRKTGEIIQRIASNSGVSGSRLESASFTALDTALAGLSNQGRIGVFIDSQISVLDKSAELAAPCNAQVGVSLAGKMFVGRVAIGSPTITLDAQQRQLPTVISSSEASVSPPFSYIEMGYARAERVHTDDEIAFVQDPEPGATNDANLDDPTQLTINEKTRLIPREVARSGRKAQLRSRMVALGISVTALDAAEANWLTYRDSVVPAWNANSQHSTINRATWNSLTVLYDAALDAGDKAVSEEDAKRANWSNVAQTPNAPADNATVGAVAGTNLTDVNGNQIGADNIRNNLALIDWWKDGATIPWSGNGGLGNSMITMPHPSWPALSGPLRGIEDAMLVRANADGQAAGGWNSAPTAPLNPDKTYRFVVPIMQPADNSYAWAFWGPLNVATLNGTTAESNPYFAGSAGLTRNRWHLFVGFIFPRNSKGKSNSSAGIWDCATGVKIADGTNYCFLPNGTQPLHRAYQFYAAPFAYQFIGKPLINLADGTEPDLRMYLAEALLLNNQQRFDEILPGFGRPELNATVGATSGVNMRRENGAVVGDALLMNDNQRFDQIVLGFGRPELNADVTLTAQVSTIAPDDVTINATSGGVINAGQFPKTLTPRVTRGGVSARTDNRATYSATNITGGLVGNVTMNNISGSADKGRATISNATSSGTYQHNIFWDNVLIASYLVRANVVAAAAPVGGGGSGGYSGNFDVTGFTLFGAGFVEVSRISNLSNLNGNILRCTLPFATYQAQGSMGTVSRSALVKAQYSPAGSNSWTDVASAVTGSESTWFGENFSGDEGTVSLSVSTAIPPGAAYFDVRLVASMNVSGGGASVYFTGGTFSAVIGT
jgi:hypothetical protein